MAKFLVTVLETHQIEVNAPDQEAAVDFASEIMQVNDIEDFEIAEIEEVGLDVEEETD